MTQRSAHDCIVAIATAQGQGAIAVVRLSGREALVVADKVFAGKTRLQQAEGYTVHFGKIVDGGGEVLDVGLATVFREPQSYTGEDVVEFSCHGGPVIARSVLKALEGAGARQADPGEFTRRAFLNGKMDLSQAEAIADLIVASSARAQRSSVAQLQGKLGAAIGQLRVVLLDLCALLEVELDFAEEGIELIGASVLGEKLAAIDGKVARLVESYQAGRVYRDGVLVALAGKPNAGKSSLFNTLLKEERAIVAPHPGTTRDSIEEGIDVGGVLVRLTDTAGLRESRDTVEAEGIRRAKSVLRSADIVLVVVDATTVVDASALRETTSEIQADQRAIVALHKADLLTDTGRRRELLSLFGPDSLFTSSVTGEGVHSLSQRLVETSLRWDIGETPDLHVTSERHYQALLRARTALASARSALLSGKGNEFIAFDIREVVTALGEITGEITSDEVLNSIFGRFCIGK